MKDSKDASAFSSALIPAGPCVAQDAFVREKLLLLSLVLACAPLGLAFHGVPSPTEAALFAAGLMPLAGALLAARAGGLAMAHLIAAGGELAIAVLLAPFAGAAAAIAWLMLAVIETALAYDRVLLRWAGIALLPAASMIVLLSETASPLQARASMPATICALAVAALTAWRCAGSPRPALVAAAPVPARAKALAEALGDAVAVFDEGGLLLDPITGCEAFLGAEANGLSGRAFLDLVNVADRPAFLTLLADAAHGGGVTSGTMRMRTAATGIAKLDAPRALVIEMRARRAGDEIVAILRDVTETQRKTAIAERAQMAEDTSLLSKDHFITNMSHELRTPLNAIIGFSELLGSRTLSPADPAKQREYAGIIHEAGQQLLSVVNSILDVSKIQSGTFALLPEPFAIEALAEQCCEAVRPQAEDRGVTIVRDVPVGLEEIVADRRACRQILINLLSNAVKFTPAHGRVTLAVRTEGTALRVSITDTGIGIAKSDVSRLGDPFFQARASLSRPYEGTGLGLSVVRGLVGLHGGSIAIDSEIGRGTAVTVHLPLDCRLGDATSRTAVDERHGSVEPVRRSETRGFLESRFPDRRLKKSA